MSIQKNIKKIQSEIPPQITLLVASKYASYTQIQTVLDAGITHLGENKIQDAEKKIDHFGSKTIKWHFIGHLQSNKVNKAVSLFHTIQSVDSVKLLKKIDQSAEKAKKKQNIFLQINMANDPAKFGFSIEDFTKNILSFSAFQNVSIKGIMSIVPYSEEEEDCRAYFKEAKRLQIEVNTRLASCTELSMGMSNDYIIAIEEGSTLVRLGSKVFKGDLEAL